MSERSCRNSTHGTVEEINPPSELPARPNPSTYIGIEHSESMLLASAVCPIARPLAATVATRPRRPRSRSPRPTTSSIFSSMSRRSRPPAHLIGRAFKKKVAAVEAARKARDDDRR